MIENPRLDSDLRKGAIEEDKPTLKSGGPSMYAQLDHRSSDPDIKDADTDFPEPDASAEHSGERRAQKKICL